MLNEEIRQLYHLKSLLFADLSKFLPAPSRAPDFGNRVQHKLHNPGSYMSRVQRTISDESLLNTIST